MTLKDVLKDFLRNAGRGIYGSNVSSERVHILLKQKLDEFVTGSRLVKVTATLDGVEVPFKVSDMDVEKEVTEWYGVEYNGVLFNLRNVKCVFNEQEYLQSFMELNDKSLKFRIKYFNI